MRYGHFDDANKEYVIDRPDTPRSWTNFHGNPVYGSVMTNNAGGFSFYRSGILGRFMRFRTNAVPMDQPGRYFYLRDRANGDFWTSSWQPVAKPLDRYQTTTRFGTGYTVITSRYSDIETEATYFVPLDQHFEYWRLKVTNKGPQARQISLFPYCEFANEWSMRQDIENLQYTQYTSTSRVVDNVFERASNGYLPADPANFMNNDQGRWNFMTLTGAPVTTWEGDRERFIGPYGCYDKPAAVIEGRLPGTSAYGDNICGAAQVDLTLAPGETRDIIVMIGIGDAAAGKKIRDEWSTPERCDAEFIKMKAGWHKYLGALVCETPDAEFNSMVNVWNAYNCLVTFYWSRAASIVYNGDRDGFGYRDTVQDLMGVMAASPDDSRERLELMMSGQESRGSAMPVVRPFAHKPGSEPLTDIHILRADDCMWLFNSVQAYVKETGDLAFYDKVVPYSDAGSASVLCHLRRAIEFNLEYSGKHGLPCGLHADWNDCLRMGFKGETVFVAFQLRLALVEYVEITKRLGRASELAWAEGHLTTLDKNIQAVSWDGAWFKRAFGEDGQEYGSKTCAEGKIWLNPQSWAVISGAATKDQTEAALASVKAHLASKHGVTICDPAFANVPCKEIRSVLMVKGVKENGGIFSQTQPWIIMAEAIAGHPDRAYEYLRAFMPAAYNDQAEIRQIEPYAHCQSTHAPVSPKFGNSRISWLSGTASWAYWAMTQYILGIRTDYDGLRIVPCIPSAWPSVKVNRIFRGKAIEVRITRGPTGVGVASMTVNGKPIQGDLIKASDIDGCAVVEVVTK